MPKVLNGASEGVNLCLKANSGVAKTDSTVHITIHYANAQDH